MFHLFAAAKTIANKPIINQYDHIVESLTKIFFIHYRQMHPRRVEGCLPLQVNVFTLPFKRHAPCVLNPVLLSGTKHGWSGPSFWSHFLQPNSVIIDGQLFTIPINVESHLSPVFPLEAHTSSQLCPNSPANFWIGPESPLSIAF